MEAQTTKLEQKIAQEGPRFGSTNYKTGAETLAQEGAQFGSTIYKTRAQAGAEKRAQTEKARFELF